MERARHSIAKKRSQESPREAGDGLLQRLEAHRDFHFRRVPERRVKGQAQALAFIETVGFCTAFTPGLGVPCLREAIAGQREPPLPEHIQHDYAIVTTWQIKDRLPAERRVYYGKAIAGRPAFVSLELLPAFVRLRAPTVSHVQLYRRGLLSSCAKQVMDELARRGPSETRALKLASGYSAPNKRPEFDRAMKELQQKFLALKVEERYEPFTYVWGTLADCWPDAFAAARKLTAAEATLSLVRRYVETAGYAHPSSVGRLLEIPPALVDGAIKRLVAARVLANPCRIPSLTGAHWVLESLAQTDK